MEMHGMFHWNELMTGDVDKSKSFYTAVCGWTYEEMPMPEGTYTLAKSGDNIVGGIMDKAGTQMPDMPSNWGAYIAIDDPDAACAKVEGAGGKVIAPCFDVEGVGRIAIIQDPDGALIGIMKPADNA